MDEIDLQILEILKKNARTKNVTIAEKVGLTEGAVRRRIEKMIESGEIVKFTIESSAEFEGIVLIKTELQQIPGVRAKIEKYVDRMFELAGDYDIAALIQAFTIEKLNEKVDKIRKTPGVLDSKTLIKLVD
ncbi:MAG: AsnC family transcriptional regulator [Candidatus Heimdallarchaeota archaeon]|nr:AsnC family transcriptional regulator [Candidatus Heimdallarchaeota archaeon]